MLMHPEGTDKNATGWQFRSEDGDVPNTKSPVATSHDEPITWSASEYITHSKTLAWYLQLSGVAIVAAGLFYWITRDFVVVGTIFVVAILFGVVAGRKPRVRNYGIDTQGITIGEKKYPYGMFKSFSVIQEGPIRSIFLMPVKRFNPPMSLYYPPEGENEIVEVVGSHLAQEAREQDAIDRFMHKIRF